MPTDPFFLVGKKRGLDRGWGGGLKEGSAIGQDVLGLMICGIRVGWDYRK